MFWVFSESLGIIRHLISSVNKGNSLFLQGHWAVLILSSGCRVTAAYITGHNICLWKCHIPVLMHSVDETHLKVMKLQPHAQDRQTNRPLQLQCHRHQLDLNLTMWLCYTIKACVWFIFWVFIPVGAMFVVGSDLELKVEAVLLFFLFCFF